ncbi:MAG: crossover junction endodeoxyribonuclease RuvC [Parcubacteria group bacterium]|nr:crossover junction endodeoxyribonuclease RuvC [Parcubacteria group bacterium]
MIILGIDPGSHRIGYGVIKYENGKTSCLDYGIIELTGKKSSKGLPKLHKNLNDLIKKFTPDLASIEKLFFFKNSKTVIEVAEARGVILFTLEKSAIPIIEFTPLQVKSYVSGYGRAQKTGIQKMVKLLLNLETDPKPDDAADALALALCATTIKQ